VIALAGEFPGDRVRFSAAHELGHLVLHGPQERSREVEVEADAFAAELLTPLAAMSRAFPRRPTLGNLTMLKTEWGVSIRSLIRRARELEIIDQLRAVSLYKQISARGWNRAEPGYVPNENPRAFRKLVEISYGPGPNMQRFASDTEPSSCYWSGSPGQGRSASPVARAGCVVRAPFAGHSCSSQASWTAI
jgi:Zn-dependent peptidase ImmA (M78 family)